MSKTSYKAGQKKIGTKATKRIGKTSKSSKSNMLKITVLPIETKDPPYIKSFSNKNNENNLKLVWPRDELAKIYSNILKPKEKSLNSHKEMEFLQPKSSHNYSVYTK